MTDQRVNDLSSERSLRQRVRSPGPIHNKSPQKYHHLHSNFPFLFLFFKTSATQIHLQDLDPNPSMATPDHLFNLRNNFYLGAYQAAINSSEVSNLSPDDIIERDTLVFRCYISLGQLQFVISEINDSAPTPLQAVKLLALYFSSPDSKVTISSISLQLFQFIVNLSLFCCRNRRSRVLKNGLRILRLGTMLR